MSGKAWMSLAALAAALVLFVAVNIVAGQAMRSARIDLTDGKLYTLSDGSRLIAAKLNDSVQLTLYVSQKQLSEAPPIQAYVRRVRETLEELVRASGGKLTLRTVDPEPFSEAEDRAVQAGLAAIPTGAGGERLYFGLVGSNSVDQTEVIRFFDPQKESFLEYDLTRLIYLLSNPTKSSIGIMSWLPIEGQEGNPMMGGRGVPAWQIHRKLKELFEVRSVATSATEIPADVKVLLVIHPKGISEPTQYAIDQFVLRGGRAIVMVDPNCEADVPPGMNPMQAMQIPKASDLPKLFSAWGIELAKDKVVLDQASAVSVRVGSDARPETVPYVAWLMIGGDNRASGDPITGQLERMFVGTAGAITKKDGTATSVQPLLTTSATAMLGDASLVSFIPEPKKLLAEFKPGSTALTLAARVTGKVKSAFPDGPPAAAPPAEGQPPIPPPTQPHIAESGEPIDVVVIADCDMIADKFWINEARLGGMLLGYDEFSDNGSLLVNAADNLSGSKDLASLRARGKFSRPFTKVEELQKAAQQSYQAKEQELQKKLRDTEQKISDMQRQRPDSKDNRVLLTPEQQAEIDKFRAEMIATRRELRDVQFQLTKDTERLGTTLKAINIGLMPLLVGAGALGLAAYRSSRRRADRLASAKS
ncbi:MAG: GldG family protein [Phycisphaerales bacterium]|nr:GldG family protein [Phycisphaerales bacterium]